MRNHRIRTHPRMSANKLGEYMIASPSRRRQIIKDQKRPNDFIVPRYDPAEKAISELLVDRERRDEIIYRQLERLSNAKATTKWEIDRKRLCIEALESFLEIADEIKLEGLEYRRTDSVSQPIIDIAGVAVSVRPEILLTGRRRGTKVCGAIKLYLSKSHLLNEVSGDYVATIVHHFMTKHHAQFGIPYHGLCFVIDVFGQRTFVAPRAFTRRFADLQAGCEEIARAWKDL